MKKYIIAIFTFIMIFCCVNVVYANQIGVEINGNVVSFIDEVPFIDRNNRVLVPLRAVADAMGIDVIWNEEAYQVALSKKYQKEYKIAIYDDLEKEKKYITYCQVTFSLGSKSYWTDMEYLIDNGVTEKGQWYGRMNTIPILKKDKVYVPITYIAEEFGYTVNWNEKTNTVEINDKNDVSIIHKLKEIQNNPFLEEIKKNIEVYCSCVLEMFCADVEWKEHYFAVYESEKAYDNGSGLPAVLYAFDSEMPKGNYFEDPTKCDYYKVNNFKTNNDVRQYLKKYLSDSVIENWFDNDFLEYNGNLYMRRGARGYGALICEAHSMKFAGEKYGRYYVTVDFLLFDELEYTVTLEFENIDGNWILTKENK